MKQAVIAGLGASGAPILLVGASNKPPSLNLQITIEQKPCGSRSTCRNVSCPIGGIDFLYAGERISRQSNLNKKSKILSYTWFDAGFNRFNSRQPHTQEPSERAPAKPTVSAAAPPVSATRVIGKSQKTG